ncbi:hypothetical protein GWK47_023126 [Chionoecetes opilio]|uniref:Uncharacterized protein n=1 Tax=Chionoecetes opilio TaxID=41210 RepID=A0A8J4XRJ0_CHIOP|nr:hypothetical protein GWK47_023126 [Chionoecetes opilio]
MPRGNDAASAPANQIFRYEVRLLGIDEVRQQNQSADDQHRYSVGDRVWIRHPSRRCNSRSLEGTVTRLVSPQNVEVDGMPRHETSSPKGFASSCSASRASPGLQRLSKDYCIIGKTDQ